MRSSDKEKRKRIVVVDDEHDITLVLKLILEDKFSVDTYNDPLDAISEFTSGKYDLALIDYLMPNMNGFELYQKMRQIDPKIGICIMTAYEIFSSNELVRQYNLLEPAFEPEFLVKKPFDLGEILSKLGLMISHRRTCLNHPGIVQ